MATTSVRGLLQIGEVAERTGLSLRTVRHYEEVGLVPVAERSPGGFRLYTEAAIERLLVIKQLKPLDVTLEQMRELLDALDRPLDDEVRQVIAGYELLVSERVVRMRERLAGAQALQDSLRDLLA